MIKNDIHLCQKRKYRNTNTQIHKHTNTAYDEVPEEPNKDDFDNAGGVQFPGSYPHPHCLQTRGKTRPEY